MSFEQDFEKKLTEMIADLKGESDRATVIIIAAHIDTQLEEILRLALVPSWSSTDSMFDGANAPFTALVIKLILVTGWGLLANFWRKVCT